MRIANVMFGRGLGGIEQAFLDYNEALLLAGYEVLAITHPLASIIPHITGKLDHDTVANYGNWDPFAWRRLKKIYAKWQPRIIISHGNRALNLNDRVKKNAFHLGITHNYRLKHFGKLDGIIATTADLELKVRQQLPDLKNIVRIPNMVRLPRQPLAASARSVPVIGAMGRLIPKKGMHLLLKAMQQLKQQGVECQLHLGGEGPQERHLKALVKKLEIADRVHFLGWVEDKTTFFADIDIFCLPSLHEPFGIVLLEAMAHYKPVVAFATEGPTDIVRHEEAVLIPSGNVDALAQGLQELLEQPDKQKQTAEMARNLVMTEYALPVVSGRIASVLQNWVKD